MNAVATAPRSSRVGASMEAMVNRRRQEMAGPAYERWLSFVKKYRKNNRSLSGPDWEKFDEDCARIGPHAQARADELVRLMDELDMCDQRAEQIPALKAKWEEAEKVASDFQADTQSEITKAKAALKQKTLAGAGAGELEEPLNHISRLESKCRNGFSDLSQQASAIKGDLQSAEQATVRARQIRADNPGLA